MGFNVKCDLVSMVLVIMGFNAKCEPSACFVDIKSPIFFSGEDFGHSTQMGHSRCSNVHTNDD